MFSLPSPHGFNQVDDLFERNGRRSPGCVNNNGPQGMIDYLRPKESLSLKMLLVPEQVFASVS